MNFIEYSRFVEVSITVVSAITTIAATLGTVWAIFRKKINNWWSPYRAAVDNMATIPEISRTLDKTRQEVTGIGRSVAMLTLATRARSDTNADSAEFEADAAGAVTYVNATYARWLGVSKSELLGWGWINFVDDGDAQRVRDEWDLCRHEHRAYRQRYRMLSYDNEKIEVEAICAPIPDAPPAHCWVGTIRKIGTR